MDGVIAQLANKHAHLTEQPEELVPVRKEETAPTIATAPTVHPTATRSRAPAGRRPPRRVKVVPDAGEQSTPPMTITTSKPPAVEPSGVRPTESTSISRPSSMTKATVTTKAPPSIPTKSGALFSDSSDDDFPLFSTMPSIKKAAPPKTVHMQAATQRPPPPTTVTKRTTRPLFDDSSDDDLFA